MSRLGPPTFREAMADYKLHRRGSYSPGTWRVIDATLTRLEDWICEQTQPNVYLEDVNERHVIRYFDRLRPPRYSPGTFNNYRQTISMFFKFCIEEGLIRINPMRHINAMKVPRRVRLQLSAEEMLMMLEVPNPRDRVALAVSMNTALRAGDITFLKIGSPDFTTNRMTAWIEKTDEEVQIPMTADLRKELLDWLGVYAAETGRDLRDLPNDWTLIPPMKSVNRSMSQADGRRLIFRPTGRITQPEKIVHRALTRLGYETFQEGFHTLRRSAARVVFEAAKAAGDPDPIAIPQTLLGHKSRATTERYIGVSVEKVRLDEMLRGKSFLTDAAARDRAVIEEGEHRLTERGVRRA